MTVIRAFVALELPSSVQDQLEGVLAQMSQVLEGMPIRWVPAGNIHLTLKFLGDVSLANLEILCNLLQIEAAVHPAFELSVGGLGAYPSTNRPRVIWIGIEAPAELIGLQTGIENSVARIGYAREERPFSPHLTLGRISRSATPLEVRRIGEVLQRTKVGFLGVVHVSEVTLFRSDLNPGGAIYTRMFTAPLKDHRN